MALSRGSLDTSAPVAGEKRVAPISSVSTACPTPGNKRRRVEEHSVSQHAADGVKGPQQPLVAPRCAICDRVLSSRQEHTCSICRTLGVCEGCLAVKRCCQVPAEAALPKAKFGTRGSFTVDPEFDEHKVMAPKPKSRAARGSVARFADAPVSRRRVVLDRSLKPTIYFGSTLCCRCMTSVTADKPNAYCDICDVGPFHSTCYQEHRRQCQRSRSSSSVP